MTANGCQISFFTISPLYTGRQRLCMAMKGICELRVPVHVKLVPVLQRKNFGTQFAPGLELAKQHTQCLGQHASQENFHGCLTRKL